MELRFFDSATTGPGLTSLDASSWQAVLQIAVVLCGEMPLGHELKELADSAAHVSIAEVDDANWHASAMRIRQGCYFLACSRALRAAMTFTTRCVVYVNAGTDHDAYRAQVMRYVFAMASGIRVGNGWRQYADVTLQAPLAHNADRLVQIGQLFVVLHELAHTARWHRQQVSTAGDAADSAMEEACDEAALAVLVARAARIGTNIAEIAAAAELLMTTQALLEDAHWWSGPQFHPWAPRRRRRLARQFNGLVASQHQLTYQQSLDAYFPELAPATIPLAVGSGDPRPTNPLPLSQTISTLPQVFTILGPTPVWVEQGCRYIDSMEAADAALNAHSFRHFTRLAQVQIPERTRRRVRQWTRSRVAIPRQTGLSLIDQIRHRRTTLARLADTIAGQLLFFEKVIPAVNVLEKVRVRDRRGLSTAEFVAGIRETFGPDATEPILALLYGFYKLRTKTLPIDESGHVRLCRILAIVPDPQLPGYTTSQTLHSMHSIFRDRSLDHYAMRETWIDVDEWERQHPDKVWNTTDSQRTDK
ncbi:MAG TPA: hypothetical protein VFC00_40565 [Micromonosporaceae bacterium]|nr:hypothetical protein [Micromonosporaceae bacterium]